MLPDVFINMHDYCISKQRQNFFKAKFFMFLFGRPPTVLAEITIMHVCTTITAKYTCGYANLMPQRVINAEKCGKQQQ